MKNKLIFILKKFVSEYEKEYIELKKSKSFIHTGGSLRYTYQLKDAQKCLEYIRKDYPFEYKIDEGYISFMSYDYKDHEIKVFGRDTWKKMNRMFETKIPDKMFIKYEKQFLRTRKLEKILKNE